MTQHDDTTRPSADLTQQMLRVQQMQQNDPMPESPAIVHFADAPNGDVWLAARTAAGVYVTVRRAHRDEMGEVALELRRAANGAVERADRLSDPLLEPPSTSRAGLSLIR